MEHPEEDRIQLIKGDITTLDTDVIVNAANQQLSGCFEEGCDCVDRAVHEKAGPALKEACEKQMRAIRQKVGETYVQPLGIPMMTDAFLLPAKKIVHVAGPAVNGEVSALQTEQLAMCYKNTLLLCEKRGMKRIAFCCISTGKNRFPRRKAAETAVKTVKAYLAEHPAIEQVVFAVFRDEDYVLYRELLKKNP